MKKIIISEEQYKRVFLLEQPAPKPSNTKGDPSQFGTQSWQEQQRDKRTEKNKSLGISNKDPYGWATYGAPNKQTGTYKSGSDTFTYGPLDPIPSESIDALEEAAELEMKDSMDRIASLDAEQEKNSFGNWKDKSGLDASQAKIDYYQNQMDATGAGKLGVDAKFNANKTIRQFGTGGEDNLLLQSAKNFNKLISKEWQEYLIKSQCKPVVRKRCASHCGDSKEEVMKNAEAKKWWKEGLEEDYVTANGKYGLANRAGWFNSLKICGKAAGKETYVKDRVGFDRRKESQWCIWKMVESTDTVWKKDCPGCFNKSSGGLFVYPLVEDMSDWNVTNNLNTSKYTYHCGCVNNMTKSLAGCPDNNLTRFGMESAAFIRGIDQKQAIHAAKNEPSFFEKLADWGEYCVSDPHCLIDVASVVVLVVPGIGPLLSMGLDVANGIIYGVEGYMSDNKTDKYANYTAGVLTIVGGVATGYKLAKSLAKIKNASPKVMKFTDDFLGEIAEKYGKKGTVIDDVIKKDIDDMFKKKMLSQGLTKAEVKYSVDIISDVSKFIGDKKSLKTYVNGLQSLENKFDKVKLQQVFAKKRYQKLLKESDGDVLIALDKYSKLPEGKMVLTQLGFFAAGEALLPGLINGYITDKSLSGDWGPRKLVEALGYDWVQTKKIFGAISKTNEDGSKNEKWTKEKSIADNTLLQKAINSGWRPYEMSEKLNPTTIERIPVPEKYQTELYKQNEKGQYQRDIDQLQKDTDEYKSQMDDVRKGETEGLTDKQKQEVEKREKEDADKFKEVDVDLSKRKEYWSSIGVNY